MNKLYKPETILAIGSGVSGTLILVGLITCAAMGIGPGDAFPRVALILIFSGLCISIPTFLWFLSVDIRRGIRGRAKDD